MALLTCYTRPVLRASASWSPTHAREARGGCARAAGLSWSCWPWASARPPRGTCVAPACRHPRARTGRAAASTRRRPARTRHTGRGQRPVFAAARSRPAQPARAYVPPWPQCNSMRGRLVAVHVSGSATRPPGPGPSLAATSGGSAGRLVAQREQPEGAQQQCRVGQRPPPGRRAQHRVPPCRRCVGGAVCGVSALLARVGGVPKLAA